MKKMLTVVIMLFVSSCIFHADNLNQQQQKLRDEIKIFLSEEGFMPEIDSDGEIHFKKEGRNYYVSISDTDTAPMYVSLSIAFDYPEGYSTDICKLAANEMNRYKAIKTVCYDSGFYIRAEMFLNDPNQFKCSFHIHMVIMDHVREDFIDECEAISAGRSSSYDSTSSSADII